MNPYSYHMITYPKGNAVDPDMPEIVMEDSYLVSGVDEAWWV
jgi:hypothetical protein